MLELIGVLALMLFIFSLVRAIMDNRLKNKILQQQASQDLVGRILRPESARSKALASLKWSLVLIGIGLGIAFGQFSPSGMKDEITLAAIFVFAGLGYFVYYLVALRAAKAE